jgi:hypothetical protein
VTSEYGRGALRRVDQAIRELVPGGRNPGLFPHAAGIYELVAGGEIDTAEADQTLIEAGTSIGLPLTEVRSVLRSAWRKGTQRPRRRPEPSPSTVATLPPERPPQYPDAEIVAALWDASVSVLADEKARAYLERRGLDPVRVSRFGRARVIPEDAEIPDELTSVFGQAIPNLRVGDRWKQVLQLGFNLVLPLVDACGHRRSLQLRCIEAHDEAMPTKGVCLKPNRRELVLANRTGLALLSERGRPPLWCDQPLEVVIVEGESDYLTAATEEIPDGTFRAVLGIFAGSWRMKHALAIPLDATVVIATDDDAQGDKYAQEITWTLGERSFSRWRPHVRGQDLSDAGGIAGGALQCIQTR